MNKEKVIVVSDEIYKNRIAKSYFLSNQDDYLTIITRVLPADVNHLIFGGEEYKIIEILDSNIYVVPDSIIIPFTSLPKETKVWFPSYTDDSNDTKLCFSIWFKNPITHQQYNDIVNCLQNNIGNLAYVESIEFTDVNELEYFRTVIFISIVIALLTAINMAILYRYILEKRSTELAIIRMCGCSKGRAILLYILECVIINVPLFVLTQYFYHNFIMTRLSVLFPYMSEIYNLKLYAIHFCGII